MITLKKSPKLINLEGQRYGRWTVMRYAGKRKWECKCDCGNVSKVSSSNLKYGISTSCGCFARELCSLDLTGQKYGKWTPIKYLGKYYWECKCDCGTIRKVSTCSLRNGSSKSCGCLKKELMSKAGKKYNKYDLTSKEFGIGYTSNTNEKFYFDKEDYEKIKDYCWFKNSDGPIEAPYNDKKICLHNLLSSSVSSRKEVIYHINGNYNDNRKQNLKMISRSYRSVVNKPNKNNVTGVRGVYYKCGKYKAYIYKNYEEIFLGEYNTLSEAAKARENGVRRFYSEFIDD